MFSLTNTRTFSILLSEETGSISNIYTNENLILRTKGLKGFKGMLELFDDLNSSANLDALDDMIIELFALARIKKHTNSFIYYKD